MSVNVIKLNSETRPGVKMESKTAWGKALCRLFFVQARKNAHSKQSGWITRFKKCSYEPNYATL